MASDGPDSHSILPRTFSYPPTTPTAPNPETGPTSSALTTSLPQLAQRAFASWLPALAPWELYLTLTYDPRREGVNYVRPSPFACSRHLRKFHLQATEATRRPTYLCGTLENTRAGWPHWHGLLAAGDLSAGEFSVLSSAWYQAHGFAYFERIQPGTGSRVAEYVAKYLTKAGSEVELLGPWQTRTAVLQGTLASIGPGRRRRP